MRIAAASVCVVLACAALHAPLARADLFPLVSQDGFEDCALAFADLDGDGFGGAGDVAHRCDPLPADYVRIGSDCNDLDVDVNPDAIELRPDVALADENCDGVDGDAAMAVFVSPTGSTDPSCGARVFPCALSVASSVAADTGKSQLFLATGDHLGPLLLENTNPLRRIFGGYSADFRQRVADPTPRPTRLLGGDLGDATVALQLSGIGQWTVTDVAVIAPDAVGQIGDGIGKGSFGIRVRADAGLDMFRCDVVAGAGSSGAAGMPGASADPLAAVAGMDGGIGGNGVEASLSCDATSRGLGGPGGVNSCGGGRATNAGSGGNGGTMDTSCGGFPDFTARPGSNGTSASFIAGAAGAGGLGGSGGSTCGPTTGGGSGAISDGSGGLRATATTIASDLVFAGNGGPGELGQNGGGGGGGGGSGGCDEGTDAWGPGGGGGGAGGCAAPVAGLGGMGGGSSIGIGAFDGAFLYLEDVHIATANGGDGGNGGAGGQGQAAGIGAFGGANPGSAIPGRGGDGGRGGHAGGGAGGNGGHSIAIFRVDAGSHGTVSYSLGNPGAPGSGGLAPAAASGQSGNGGTSANVFTCASPAAC